MRPAPSAARTAISPRRLESLARIRFATFAQTMSSRKPTAAEIISSAGRTVVTSCSCAAIEPRAPAGVAVRIGRREAAGDERHLALRLLERDAVGQPADDVQRARLARAAVAVVGIETERRPDVDVAARRKIELGRHDADNGVGDGVELNLPADRARRAAEVPLPERAAQDGDAGRRRERLPRRRTCARASPLTPSTRKQVRRRAHARDVERLGAAGKRVAQLAERGHRRDGARSALSSRRR